MRVCALVYVRVYAFVYVYVYLCSNVLLRRPLLVTQEHTRVTT
jgi:hypothetical protein